ncbi:MAG: hypothetical protein AAFX56_05905 [Pseudomonadota bacterium]
MRAFAVPVVAASLFVVPTHTFANELEARKTVLLQCAEQQIAIEKTRDHPSADRVIEACIAEARAFETLLSADVASGARRHLKHVIQHRLE